MDLKVLNDKRVSLIHKMRALNDKAEKENTTLGGDLTADQQTEYANMEAELGQCDRILQRHRSLLSIEDSARKQLDANYNAALESGRKTGVRSRKVDADSYIEALDTYARAGMNGIQPHIRAALQEGTAAAGGFLVPTEFETALVQLLVNLDPVRANAHIITTASDRAIPIEVSKGTFAYMGENGTYGKTQPSFGQEVLSAFKSGGIVQVSEELLLDAAFDLQSYLVGMAGDAYNNLEEINFANGDGVNKPKGLFQTDSVAGVALGNVLGAAAGAITADNIVDTYHALARRYRQNASWLMSDNTVKLIRKIKTGLAGDTTYIWQPGLTADRPDTLLGRPVLITGGAPDAAANARSMVLVDLSKYYIADRVGISMMRMDELYAESGQVGFRFTRRNDARLVDPKAASYFVHGP